MVWWWILAACTGDPQVTDTEPTDTEHTGDTEHSSDTEGSDTETSSDTEVTDTEPTDTEDTEPTDTEELDDCTRAGFAEYLELTDADELREALQAATAGLSCDYGDARDTMFLELDNHDGLVTCVYTGDEVEVVDERPDGEVMNTEHTWPQSQGADTEPAKCDLHHLYPTLNEANALRASYPFGEVDSVVESLGLSALGYTSEGELAFEPPEWHKGNVARSLLYFSVRYELELDAAQFAVVQAWHERDPPDEDELARTFGIEAAQGHANPFVVCPEFVAVIDNTP